MHLTRSLSAFGFVLFSTRDRGAQQQRYALRVLRARSA